MTAAPPPRFGQGTARGARYVRSFTLRRHARETAEVAEWAARGLTHPSLLADPAAVLGLDDMDDDDVTTALAHRLDRNAS